MMVEFVVMTWKSASMTLKFVGMTWKSASMTLKSVGEDNGFQNVSLIIVIYFPILYKKIFMW